VRRQTADVTGQQTFCLQARRVVPESCRPALCLHVFKVAEGVVGRFDVGAKRRGKAGTAALQVVGADYHMAVTALLDDTCRAM